MLLKPILTIVFVFLLLNGFSQVEEKFSDGNLSQLPRWYGDTSSWKINIEGRLQSFNSTSNTNFHISTTNNRLLHTSWSFYCKMDFNPSSANYIDFYLTATDTAFNNSGNVGYFVRLGNTDDEISLYRKDPGGIVKIMDGVNGSLNASSSELLIRITRDSLGFWRLNRNILHRENIWVYEGTVLDTSYCQTQYCGIVVKQSTASFFNRHYIDDIDISEIVPDTIAPLVSSIDLISPDTLILKFSKPMDSASTCYLFYYQMNQGIGFPRTVTKLSNDRYALSFDQSVPVRTQCLLRLSGMKDMNGNVLRDTVLIFYRYTPAPYDILIHEIMADPSPTVGLPDIEWLELYNPSGMDINLHGWRVGKGSTLSGPMPDVKIPPDSFLLIGSTSSLATLSNYGRSVSVTNFPVLSNDADEVFLRADNGISVHAVGYDYSWYRNEVKSQGGWTLEMIDPHYPCTGSENWQASICPVGGTPGWSNSISNSIIDHIAPIYLKSYVMDSVTLCIEFNETIDSITATNTRLFQLDHAISVLEVCPQAPLFRKILLKISHALVPAVLYHLQLGAIADCAGNIMNDNASIPFGLPQHSESADLVINEILFDPPLGESDFVELFNNSPKTIDLSTILLGRRNLSGNIIDIVSVSSTPDQILPGEFRVLTENPDGLMRAHVVPHPSWLLKTPALPTLPDEEGNLVLLNSQGDIIDEVLYQDEWHFALINNKEGVSLERVAPGLSGKDKSNWHSASSVSGFATPTARNSQFHIIDQIEGLEIEPLVFSPNNDGHDDFLNIHFIFRNGETVMNIGVFDVSGRKLRQIALQTLTGNIGAFRWDGTDDKGRLLPEGRYILLVETFDLTGRVRRKKTTVGLVPRN